MHHIPKLSLGCPQQENVLCQFWQFDFSSLYMYTIYLEPNIISLAPFSRIFKMSDILDYGCLVGQFFLHILDIPHVNIFPYGLILYHFQCYAYNQEYIYIYNYYIFLLQRTTGMINKANCVLVYSSV